MGYGFEPHDWSGTRVVGHGGNFWGTSGPELDPAHAHAHPLGKRGHE
jgi:hypothetical protein